MQNKTCLTLLNPEFPTLICVQFLFFEMKTSEHRLVRNSYTECWLGSCLIYLVKRAPGLHTQQNPMYPVPPASQAHPPFPLSSLLLPPGSPHLPEPSEMLSTPRHKFSPLHSELLRPAHSSLICTKLAGPSSLTHILPQHCPAHAPPLPGAFHQLLLQRTEQEGLRPPQHQQLTGCTRVMPLGFVLSPGDPPGSLLFPVGVTCPTTQPL